MENNYFQILNKVQEECVAVNKAIDKLEKELKQKYELGTDSDEA